MNIREIRGSTKEELLERESELKKELFNLRCQMVLGKMESPGRVKQVRKEIAQVKTVYNDKVANREG
ncbi:MAG: 50S ribosomal protein L29 [Nitrospirota bacterium]